MPTASSSSSLLLYSDVQYNENENDDHDDHNINNSTYNILRSYGIIQNNDDDDKVKDDDYDDNVVDDDEVKKILVSFIQKDQYNNNNNNYKKMMMYENDNTTTNECNHSNQNNNKVVDTTAATATITREALLLYCILYNFCIPHITIQQCQVAIQIATTTTTYVQPQQHVQQSQQSDPSKQQQQQQQQEQQLQFSESYLIQFLSTLSSSSSSLQYYRHVHLLLALTRRCSSNNMTTNTTTTTTTAAATTTLVQELPITFTMAFLNILIHVLSNHEQHHHQQQQQKQQHYSSSYTCYAVTRFAYQVDQCYQSIQEKYILKRNDHAHTTTGSNINNKTTTTTTTTTTPIRPSSSPPPLLALSTLMDIWEYIVHIVVTTRTYDPHIVVNSDSDTKPPYTNINNNNINTDLQLLIEPIAYLIGIFATAGINTQCWYRLYTLARTTTTTTTTNTTITTIPLSTSSSTTTILSTTSCCPVSIPIWIRLTLIRAITTAAMGYPIHRRNQVLSSSFTTPPVNTRNTTTSSSTMLGTMTSSSSSSHWYGRNHQKISSPISKYYFCFSCCCCNNNNNNNTNHCSIHTNIGLQRTINGLSVWPFRNDFGMAVWFRMEQYTIQQQHRTFGKIHSSLPTYPVLLSIRTDNGAGIVISIIPIEKETTINTTTSTTATTTATATTNVTPTTTDAYTIAISIYNSTLDHTVDKPDHQIITSKHGIILLSHIWYHIAIRHTRSRMKGVFSLSSQETITILLDGKVMCTETLPFPNISFDNSTYVMNEAGSNTNKNSSNSGSSRLLLRRSTTSHSSMNVTISFGTNFVGQSGALYIFNDNVSDATFRALYEITGGLIGVKLASKSSLKRNSGSSKNMSHINNNDTWDAKRSEMVRKSRVLDINMKPDDVEEIVLSQRRTSAYHKQRMVNKVINVLDLADGDDHHHHHMNDAEIQEHPIHLQKSAFASKIFLTWDPHRTLDNTLALELHIGAHVNMNDVYAWGFSSAQDMIGSTGGVQCIIPLIRSFLSCDIDPIDMIKNADGTSAKELKYDTMMAIPYLIRLLTAFVQGHNDNARELLRCGGIDVLEQMLLNCKKAAHSTAGQYPTTLFASLNIYPHVAQELIDAVLDLRLACSDFVSLETKVYSRLLFNFPLWFNNFALIPGAALHTDLLPVLSTLVQSNPEKVRDCVGVKEMVIILKEHVITTSSNTNTTITESMIDRYNNKEETNLHQSLTAYERRHASKILLGMIFAVLSTGTDYHNFVTFLDLVSYTLDVEFSNNNTLPENNYSEWRLFAVDLCTAFLLLLQLRPVVNGLYESLAQACSGVQGGASWILLAMVNVPDDEIRSLGIRCIASYLDVTNRGPDTPLTLGSAVIKPTMSTNHDTVRRASTRITQIAKGLTTGAQSYRPIVQQTPRLTARVVYKLLWHLLKSHRCNLGHFTEASLLDWITSDDDIVQTSLTNIKYVLTNMNTSYESRPQTLSFNIEWTKMIFANGSNYSGKLLCNPLAIGTVLRLLRFLNNDHKDRWLSVLLSLTKTSRKCVSSLAILPEWQPCIFHLISESLEVLHSRSGIEEGKIEDVTGNVSETSAALQERLDLCLQLYATLLGYLFRSGGDRSLEAVERVAALQRMAVNGNHVLILVLSSLCGDIYENGTLLDVGSISAQDWQEIDLDLESLLLKQSAKLVTDAILSKGTKGLDLTVAVRSWRSIRHLTEVIAAVAMRCDLGIVDLFDYINYQASSVDSVSKGLHGIRLSDSYVKGTRSLEYSLFINNLGDTFFAEKIKKDVDRRLCVNLSAQVLTLLDAFIFPDSSNTTVPGMQVDGLALVRFSEARLGSSQGPLISSAIRLSVLLLSLVEPCSVAFLQCVSRLRCLLCWALELLREYSATDVQSMHFHIDGDAHMNRLILAVTLHCHRALGRCSALLWEIENTSPEVYFHSKDTQKKYHRRLLRVSLELRDVVSTAYRGRNDILRTTMSTEAFEALRSSLEGDTSSTKNSKESVVRDFLSSSWVTGFSDTVSRQDLAVPEQVSMETIPLSSDQALNPYGQGFFAIEKLALESRRIVSDFESAINSCFEEYIQGQRLWAETDAVRDLEFDGDTSAKRLSENHKLDVQEYSKLTTLRRKLAEGRRRAIDSKVVAPWENAKHWKLARYTDALGRRTLMVQNQDFNDHAEASYDLAIGKEQEKEELDRQKRLLAKKDLADVMRRNAAAFVVDDTQSVNSKDDGSSQHASDGDSTAEMESSNDGDSFGNAEAALIEEVLLQETIANDEQDEGWDKVENDEIVDVDVEGSTDSWAKAFIWADSESIVARFEPVMIVSLETFVEGKLLLTTHGLYFHQLRDEINVITREPTTNIDGNESDSRDRRWRLARLTEVHGRRFMLRPQALELFFSDNHELLLNFPGGVKDRDRFHSKLRHSCKVPMLWSLKSLSPRVIFQKSKFTELWKQRKISNFDYLMALNRMAGRSFNDLTQYPVFPWVLSDYFSETIDLKDSRIYRDLSKPIGALNADRLEQLLERYNELELFGFAEAEKFLYGSHYSSPGIVLHYLIRQEPFTTMAIDLQSGRFDCADRLFFNIADSWKSCMTSTSDVKELIPEFFCLPEILVNTNKFPLGRSQTGILIDDVVLPPWAKGSPFEFIRIHRLALESDYVSENLHHWVDLIFGYKQRGPRAFDAHNIFHHLSYEGSVDLTKITDEVDRNAAETHIQNFGQTPSQLLPDEPHIQRYSRENCWKPLLTVDSSGKIFRCYTPTNQYPNKRGEYARGTVLKMQIFSDFVIAIYADLTHAIYKWYPCNKTNRLRPDKVRLLARRELSSSRFAMKRGSAVSPEQMDKSSFAVGNWSVGITLGGFAKEVLRRNALLSSGRLMAGNEVSLSTAEASAIIITCGYWDGTAKAHNVDGSRVIASESGGHLGPITCLALCQDGALMVTGGQDGTVRIWVVDHPDMSIALSDGYVQTALGGSIDNEILSCCHCLWGHNSPVTCVALNANTDVVASGCESGLVCVHTLRRGDFIRSFHPPSLSKNASAGAVHKIAMGTEGNFVLQMEDKGLHTFTVNAVRLCSINAGETVNDMIICSMDEILITGGDRCHVLFRQVHNLQILTSIDLSRHGPIRCMTLTPSDMNPVEQCLFVGSDDGMISIIDEDPIHLRKDESTTTF